MGAGAAIAPASVDCGTDGDSLYIFLKILIFP